MSAPAGGGGIRIPGALLPLLALKWLLAFIGRAGARVRESRGVKILSAGVRSLAEHVAATPWGAAVARRLPDWPPAVWFFTVAGVLAFVGFVAIYLYGFDYYDLPLSERAHSPKHAWLRCSGYIGLPLAIVGSLLMVASLVYLPRKRVPYLFRYGTLRDWMAFHVFAGLVGPLAILLHAAYRPTSAIGIIAFTAMLVVVTTGLIGRYLYGRVPHSVRGRELELGEIRENLRADYRELEYLGFDPELIESTVAPGPHDPPRNILHAFARVLAGDRRLWQRYVILKRCVMADPELREDAPQLLPLIKRYCREQQWLRRYSEVRAIVGPWRFLHRWFAICMFTLMVFHIFVAVRFGDLWILGGE